MINFIKWKINCINDKKIKETKKLKMNKIIKKINKLIDKIKMHDRYPVSILIITCTLFAANDRINK